jgi:Xaa-Pro aminopeptidase
MFSTETYVARRNALRQKLNGGVAIIFGNTLVSRNYKANVYAFRQDSNFLYFFGIDLPNFIGIIDAENGVDYLVGDDLSIDDVIWMGNWPSVTEQAQKIGVTNVLSSQKFQEFINKTNQESIKILPPYSPYRENTIKALLPNVDVNSLISEDLIKSVVALRSLKEQQEIDEMEATLNNITYGMYEICRSHAREGVHEQEIAGKLVALALQHGKGEAYHSIVTTHGEILHNEHYSNTLQKGNLLLIDAGAESNKHYATDISRTYPVGRKFTKQQEEIYTIVLEAQKNAIDRIKPGVQYREIHLQTAREMVEGLINVGLFKGSSDDIVAAGAHALVFPHGLGHMIGLDVHDMEDLGENFVGYSDSVIRSTQFGTAYLRLGKELEENNVITVEPGLYFIPTLIEKWKAENKFTDFINYSAFSAYMSFGGIRIEDDVLVTENGSRVMGKAIPKEIADITF